MTSMIILSAIAIAVRLTGAIFRVNDWPYWLRAGGWILCTTAVWIAVSAAGAWPLIWFVFPVFIIGILLDVQQSNQMRRNALWLIADIVLVLVLTLLSIPKLQPLELVIVLIMVAVGGFLIDWSMAHLRKWTRLTLLGGLVIVGIGAVVIRPGTVTRSLNLILDRARLAQLPMQTTANAMYDSQNARTTISTGQVVAFGETPVVGMQWTPYLEWSLTNADYSGNPYDLVASARFAHQDTGETHVTEMFYDGGDQWKFRFTATLPGTWTFTTDSDALPLDGHSGVIDIQPNPDARGFVTSYGTQWGFTGTESVFVPQIVSASSPHRYHNNPDQIDAEIAMFLDAHGFNGFHVPVFCRWFDMEEPACGNINLPDPNPDRRTFEALELLITRVHAAGGIVHIWVWGDDFRTMNPKRWDLNGRADQRLQRYIAARLGPIPGWTMSYGFDLHEWVDGDEIDAWHTYMQDHLGWPHLLGARSSKDVLDQPSEGLDYASYEQHKPNYAKYVETLDVRPTKPAFSEDRFRIRDEGRVKDYSMEEIRQGLWNSMMAGGIANIWGNLIDAPGANTGDETSAAFPNPELIRTYADFFAHRYMKDATRCNELTTGVCLRHPSKPQYIFYIEDGTSIQMNLLDMPGMQSAIAVDTKLPYAEIDIGPIEPIDQTWAAPYPSSWAIAIGDF